LGLTSEEKHIHIDHINRVRCDNRKENLRKADYQINAINHKKRIDNKTGITGVQYINSKRNKGNPYGVDIQYKRKRYHLGYYSKFEDAVRVRLLAEKKYFGEEFAPQRHLFEQYGI
jgi:TnpA family transposase